MKLIIDIPEEEYKRMTEESIYSTHAMICAVQNGIPLPKGHGRLIDADRFLKKVDKDREHEIYMHSWTADMVLKRLDSWYAPTIIEADIESEVSADEHDR